MPFEIRSSTHKRNVAQTRNYRTHTHTQKMNLPHGKKLKRNPRVLNHVTLLMQYKVTMIQQIRKIIEFVVTRFSILTISNS